MSKLTVALHSFSALFTSGFHPVAVQVDENAAAVQAAAVLGPPPASASLRVVADIKQTASDLIAISKTGIDLGVADGALAAEALVDSLIDKVVGPLGGAIKPAEHAMIQLGANALKAAIDQRLLSFQAQLAAQGPAASGAVVGS